MTPIHIAQELKTLFVMISQSITAQRYSFHCTEESCYVYVPHSSTLLFPPDVTIVRLCKAYLRFHFDVDLKCLFKDRVLLLSS